jgi:hypothetical protein
LTRPRDEDAKKREARQHIADLLSDMQAVLRDLD